MVTKKELRAKFAKDWQKHYRLESLVAMGFERRVCPTCGKGFWTIDSERTHCADQPCQYYEFLGNPPTDKKYSYIDAWKKIEKFFVKNGHTSVKRYPVICRWFPSLFFNNASIVDFYRVDNGNVIFEFPANPLIVPQFCLRFNDIPNVGVTGRHNTCFVMVGQHSLFAPGEKNGYWKDRCAELDFNLLRDFGVDGKEIVFVEDVWLGPGAFGTTLEYFVRGLEIGNQVFTEFLITPGGYKEMNQKVIDMGAGLERFSWLSNGTPTSYDITFEPLLKVLIKKLGISYDKDLFLKYSKLAGTLNFDEVENLDRAKQDVAKKLGIGVEELKQFENLEALYAICDHTKSLTFAITDGALPSNVGGGYNLRVILRRALSFIDRFGWDIKLSDVCAMHAKHLKPLAPDLIEHMDSIETILGVETKRYKESKTRVKRIVEKIVKKNEKVDEKKLIKLYDSEGVTPEQLEEGGLEIEIPSDFYVKVTERHMVREEETVKHAFEIQDLPETERLYHKPELEFSAKVVRVFDGNFVALDRTAFYPTSGGQLHDVGTINGLEVVDVQKVGHIIIHKVKGDLKIGAQVEGKVDKERRLILKKHHTSTHIVNYAARKLLGNHIWQHGAEKDVDKARLDITHYESLTEEQLEKIEDIANDIVAQNLPVIKQVIPRTEAEQKYGFRIYQGGAVPEKKLRIISIDDIDHEACGGVHCDSTGETGFITIQRAKRIQDGIVRLEFCACEVAVEQLREKESILKEVANKLKVSEEEVPEAVERLFAEWKRKKKSNRGKRKAGARSDIKK